MSGAYEPNNLKYILQFAQRAVSATAGKEFAIIISEANQTLNWQEWSRFVTECRRLKSEAEQRKDVLWTKKG